jgi:hypothetical protein
MSTAQQLGTQCPTAHRVGVFSLSHDLVHDASGAGNDELTRGVGREVQVT